ncbi:hypothetical protein GCM10009559_81720 [Pseudonocardia zijingensis]|uniref:Uncharacterized protein n=1 Tax=Pseudonocardia zijingensis TaxID=153376 RepID=A0ABN1NK72_9PSEU
MFVDTFTQARLRRRSLSAGSIRNLGKLERTRTTGTRDRATLEEHPAAIGVADLRFRRAARRHARRLGAQLQPRRRERGPFRGRDAADGGDPVRPTQSCALERGRERRELSHDDHAPRRESGDVDRDGTDALEAGLDVIACDDGQRCVQ